MGKKCIRDYSESDMIRLIKKMGEREYRGRQLYEWVHLKRVRGFDEMSNLPKGLREELGEEFIVDPLKVVKEQRTSDGNTAKFLFELSDGETIESVWLKYKHGDSICVSSQVGCRMGCKFCASTIGGLVRNLTAGEMLSQVYDIERLMYAEDKNDESSQERDKVKGNVGRDKSSIADGTDHISNIIVMGMGEPFDNYDNLIRFIRLLTDEKGRNLSARSVTVSTCGIPEGIRKLAGEGLPVTLALSLHAPTDELREEIMPVANSYMIDEVMDACLEYFHKTGRRVTFEYSMISGVNDDSETAHELVRLCKKMQERGMPIHINLIPLNAVKERKLVRSGDDATNSFKIILEKNRINVTIRRGMGHEIDAACGQLRQNHQLR